MTNTRIRSANHHNKLKIFKLELRIVWPLRQAELKLQPANELPAGRSKPAREHTLAHSSLCRSPRSGVRLVLHLATGPNTPQRDFRQMIVCAIAQQVQRLVWWSYVKRF